MTLSCLGFHSLLMIQSVHHRSHLFETLQAKYKDDLSLPAFARDSQ